MDYNEWISRERRIRIKLLMDSPVTRNERSCRICQDCGEICLCHEEVCPNCNSNDIAQKELDDITAEVLSGKRIRCRSRFEHLA